MEQRQASCPGHCHSASLPPAPHCPLLPPCASQFLLLSLPPLLSPPLLFTFRLLFPPLPTLLRLLPCPRGRAQRVVKVNLGSSSWSPRNKASPPAQGLSCALINLREPGIGGADVSRTEATLRGERALGSGHLAPSSHMATPRCTTGRRQRRRKEK